MPAGGPTPQKVLEYFDGIGKKKRSSEAVDVTPEICALALLLSPGELAKHATRLTTSGRAYFGAHLLAEALAERLRELETIEPPSLTDPAAPHEAYHASCIEHRALRRLLQALADAESELFFQQGQFASIKRGVADARRKATDIMMVYTAVKEVLERNGGKVGTGPKSKACRLTAELLSDFGSWGIVTPPMVSTRIRAEIKLRETPWRGRWV
jgi:hypothetical protein